MENEVREILLHNKSRFFGARHTISLGWLHVIFNTEIVRLCKLGTIKCTVCMLVKKDTDVHLYQKKLIDSVITKCVFILTLMPYATEY